MRRLYWQTLGLVFCLAGFALASRGIAATAQTKAQKTLFRNGFNAAGFGNVLFDYGDVEGTKLSRLIMQAGFQLVRWEEWLSLSLGFTKTGFYTGLIRHNEAYEGENLRYDLNGPSLHLSLFPHWMLSADINYVYASARLKRNTNLAADADPSRPPAIDEATWRSYEKRTKLSGSDVSLVLILKMSPKLSLVLGGGARNLSGKSKWYTNVKNRVYEGIEARSESFSESYVMFGIRGSQF